MAVCARLNMYLVLNAWWHTTRFVLERRAMVAASALSG
jgi:hypothetical protein